MAQCRWPSSVILFLRYPYKKRSIGIRYFFIQFYTGYFIESLRPTDLFEELTLSFFSNLHFPKYYL